MSPQFEAFVARLYVNETLRRRFLADARGEATRAGLSPNEIQALQGIDRTGLELAAGSFEHKRRQRARTAHPVMKPWRRLFAHAGLFLLRAAFCASVAA
jgi:hypothetical protein